MQHRTETMPNAPETSPPDYSVGDTVLTVGETGDLFRIEVEKILEEEGLVSGVIRERRPLLDDTLGNGDLEVGDPVSITSESVLGVRDEE